MYDRSRLTRLITLALASCCVTWALAGSALARPDSPNGGVAPNAAVAPPPLYKTVQGDVDKVPAASTAPAYQPGIGDRLKTPNPVQVDHVLAALGHHGTTPAQPTAVASNNDDTGTIALIVAIVAMLTALGAMTLIALRRTRPALRH